MYVSKHLMKTPEIQEFVPSLFEYIPYSNNVRLGAWSGGQMLIECHPMTNSMNIFDEDEKMEGVLYLHFVVQNRSRWKLLVLWKMLAI